MKNSKGSTIPFPKNTKDIYETGLSLLFFQQFFSEDQGEVGYDRDQYQEIMELVKEANFQHTNIVSFETKEFLQIYYPINMYRNPYRADLYHHYPYQNQINANYRPAPPQIYPEDIECVLVSSDPSKGAIYISNVEAAENPKTLKKHSIKCVMTCAKGYHKKIPIDILQDFKYFPLEDKNGCQILCHFDEAIEFIERSIKKTNVLVHCIAGVSRSVSMVLAYLIRKEKMSYEQAFRAVQRRRKIISPNPGFINQLKIFAEQEKKHREHPESKHVKDNFEDTTADGFFPNPQKLMQNPEDLLGPKDLVYSFGRSQSFYEGNAARPKSALPVQHSPKKVKNEPEGKESPLVETAYFKEMKRELDESINRIHEYYENQREEIYNQKFKGKINKTPEPRNEHRQDKTPQPKVNRKPPKTPEPKEEKNILNKRFPKQEDYILKKRVPHEYQKNQPTSIKKVADLTYDEALKRLHKERKMEDMIQEKKKFRYPLYEGEKGKAEYEKRYEKKLEEQRMRRKIYDNIYEEKYGKKYGGGLYGERREGMYDRELERLRKQNYLARRNYLPDHMLYRGAGHRYPY